MQRLDAVLHALEQRETLYQLLIQQRNSDEVQILIGLENKISSMHDCSLITTSYHIGDLYAGSIGIVGPTRMQYDRAVALVGMVGKMLSQSLTAMYIA